MSVWPWYLLDCSPSISYGRTRVYVVPMGVMCHVKMCSYKSQPYWLPRIPQSWSLTYATSHYLSCHKCTSLQPSLPSLLFSRPWYLHSLDPSRYDSSRLPRMPRAHLPLMQIRDIHAYQRRGCVTDSLLTCYMQHTDIVNQLAWTMMATPQLWQNSLSQMWVLPANENSECSILTCCATYS